MACASQVVIVDRLSEFKYIVPGTTTNQYHPGKLMKRNEWMVDQCHRLVALHDGSTGGTGNCVNYAKSKKVHIVNLWKSWVKYRGF
ncbi:hypothetical protein H6G83_32420 [Anabaena azotica FACHB-119]|uniref:Uncharacterized protein n=2 Tax=Anabaena azotica TaxID=197653 RepID=A0ABR8DDR3_9NOST|nr:hypothetical protein [Anabaena azotica FACHB-119]